MIDSPAPEFWLELYVRKENKAKENNLQLGENKCLIFGWNQKCIPETFKITVDGVTEFDQRKRELVKKPGLRVFQGSTNKSLICMYLYYSRKFGNFYKCEQICMRKMQ